MKTLIIHPQDTSTDFLTGIYQTIQTKEVIREGVDKYTLLETFSVFDQLMMMGHGTPNGLLSLHKYISPEPYVVDSQFVDAIKKKKNSLFIWCYANHFVEQHQLKGFYTGMFISEVGEAIYCGLDHITQHMVNESNYVFSWLMSNVISEPVPEMYKYVYAKYGELALTNPVAAYNHQRLYWAN